MDRSTGVVLFAVVAAFVGIAYGAFLIQGVPRRGGGSEKVKATPRPTRGGAIAYLNRQYTTVAYVAAGLFVVLWAAGFWSDKFGILTAVGFLIGAVASASAGYVGMKIAVRANVRTAQAAHGGLNAALQVAFKGGAVPGLLLIGLGLFAVAGFYYVASAISGPDKAMHALLSLGFGGSLISVFARVGGGIFTKAADVGAALVGKVEAGIPEDDPRNPAVIADLVGDNVGDCAGRGADLFESTAAENIGAMILGAGLAGANPGLFSPVQVVGLMLFPLVARAFGLVASIIGVLVVKAREDEDPMHALNRGYMWTALLAAAGFVGGTYWLLNPAAHPAAWWHFALCGVIGIVTSIAFVYITQYYTEYRYRPVKSIAAASVTGPATNIIAGFAVALECTALPTFTISAAIIASYKLGASSGLAHSGLFGTAVATMGMLGTAAYILAMDTFGPITDNAGGIIEMSHQPEDIRRRTDRLHAVGNTTNALTQRYSIGSAARPPLPLLSALLHDGRDY